MLFPFFKRLLLLIHQLKYSLKFLLVFILLYVTLILFVIYFINNINSDLVLKKNQLDGALYLEKITPLLQDVQLHCGNSILLLNGDSSKQDTLQQLEVNMSQAILTIDSLQTPLAQSHLEEWKIIKRKINDMFLTYPSPTLTQSPSTYTALIVLLLNLIDSISNDSTLVLEASNLYYNNLLVGYDLPLLAEQLVQLQVDGFNILKTKTETIADAARISRLVTLAHTYQKSAIDKAKYANHNKDNIPPFNATNIQAVTSELSMIENNFFNPTPPTLDKTDYLNNITPHIIGIFDTIKENNRIMINYYQGKIQLQSMHLNQVLQLIVLILVLIPYLFFSFYLSVKKVLNDR